MWGYADNAPEYRPRGVPEPAGGVALDAKGGRASSHPERSDAGIGPMPELLSGAVG